jgi:hypothetical protein
MVAQRPGTSYDKGQAKSGLTEAAKAKLLDVV